MASREETGFMLRDCVYQLYAVHAVENLVHLYVGSRLPGYLLHVVFMVTGCRS